jgi:hypothetical protein
MKHEKLRNTRTFRHIRTYSSIQNNQIPKTVNSLGKTEEEIHHLVSLQDPNISKIIKKEEDRFAKISQSVKQTQENILKAREKLARMVNKNREICKIRHQLQQKYLIEDSPVIPKVKKCNSDQNPDELEIRY